MAVATSIDEAMDLLKGNVTEEETEEEDLEQGEVELDMAKAEDDEELVNLIKADEFMQALAENQDTNVETLAKAIERDMNATHAVLSFMKGFGEALQELTAKVDAIAGAPQPTKAALHKADVSDATPRAPMAEPAEMGGPSANLTKGEIVNTLRDAVLAGTASGDDLLKAEALVLDGNSHLMAVSVDQGLRSISPGGRAAIKQLIADKAARA